MNTHVKKFVGCLLFVWIAISGFAQGNETAAAVAAQIAPNAMLYNGNEQWYVQVQAGAHYTFAENIRFGSFGDGVEMSYAVSVGKNFSTAWGARLQIAGGNDAGRYYPSDVSPYYSFRHISEIAQVTFNVTNYYWKAVKGQERKWNFLLMLGPGMTHTYDFDRKNIQYDLWEFDTKSRSHFLLYGGMELSYRVNHNWNLNLEASTTWARDKYNNVKFDRPMDGLLHVMLGVRYTIGNE